MGPRIRVLTWNLNGLDEHRLDERTEAACLAMLLRPDPADVVLLQEVVARAWHAHLRPHFSHAGYRAIPAAPPEQSYFCAMFVRAPLVPKTAWMRPLPRSQMGRHLLAATVDWQGRELLVTTGHLESLKPAADERRMQLAAVFDLLRSHAGPALFGGDTNLRDAEVGELPVGVTDAWVALGRPPETAATWWFFGQRPAALRFDRVYVNDLLRVESMHPVGPGDEPMSDHAGLHVVVGPV